jgi:uncharacterized protein YPO0396
MSDVSVFQLGMLEEGQWQLANIQLVNFGPFDGYHRFDVKTGFDRIPTTVVAGDSGTGKSTLEDAFFEVMTRNGSYNTASNEGGRGGSISSEKRSLIGYVRGKLEDTEDENGNPVAQLLRDGSCNRWSAVVLTYVSDAGTVFSVAKLFWIGAGYNANSDIKQLRITMYRPFDPREVQDIADVSFTAERLRRKLGPEFKSFARVDEFLTYVYRVLKIDELGRGKDVMDLLSKIRSGVGFRSIAELFREQVLDVPQTFARAEEAAQSYHEHQDAYEKMRDKQQRVDALQDVRASKDEREEVLSRLDEHVVALSSEVFDAWGRTTRRDLLRTYASELAGRESELTDRLAEKNAELERRKTERDDLDRQLNASGYTQRLAAYDAAVSHAQDRERQCVQSRKACAQEVEPFFGKMPSSPRDFGNLKHRVQQFLDGYDAVQEELSNKYADAVARRMEIDAKTSELKEDLAYYEKNKSRIPRWLGEPRRQLAEAAGFSPEELPFAAELMEVTDERWRRAIESVYGGFARTLLVAEDRFEEFSASIDKLKLRKRMTFRAVPTGVVATAQSGASMLSGKLAFDTDSPFAGWLINTVRDEHHDALCVGTTKQLAGPGRRVTIGGQTRDGNRGAHGRDEGVEGIIGLDNSAKIESLRQELLDLHARWTRAKEAERTASERLQELVKKHSAAERIARYEFAQVDVLGAREALEVAQQDRRKFLEENEELEELEARLAQARAACDVLLKQVGSDENRLSEVQGLLRRTRDQLDELMSTQGADARMVGSDAHARGYRLLQSTGSARFADHGAEENLRGFEASSHWVRATLESQRRQLEERLTVVERRVVRQLERYLEKWPDTRLRPTVDCLPDFMALLDSLEQEGFHKQMEPWRDHMLTWIKEDLIPLDIAYRDARAEIDDKLEPINDILRTLPYGREGGRLQIVCKSNDPKSAREFSALLRSLLDYERDDSSATEEAYHRKAAKLMELIDPTDTRAEVMRKRNEVLDRRRHVTLSARVVDAKDNAKVLSTIKTLASKSGGEVAEIVAFILGAALLYRLGRDGTSRPGFAPVLLDEGFIKADSRFTSRAIAAWQGFGFQLIIAVPEEKYQSVVSRAERVLNIVADANRRSYVSTFDVVEGEDGVPELDDQGRGRLTDAVR